MIQKKALICLALLCLTSCPSYGQKAMMFNSVDQYNERSPSGIWIVEAGSEDAKSRLFPDVINGTRTVKVIKVLKGDALLPATRVATVFHPFVPGERYLLFRFNEMPIPEGGGIMDNGNISPVLIPRSFSLAKLDGKSPKEQIELILSARIEEIEQEWQYLAEERKAINNGLEFQKREDQWKNDHQ